MCAQVYILSVIVCDDKGRTVRGLTYQTNNIQHEFGLLRTSVWWPSVLSMGLWT